MCARKSNAIWFSVEPLSSYRIGRYLVNGLCNGNKKNELWYFHHCNMSCCVIKRKQPRTCVCGVNYYIRTQAILTFVMSDGDVLFFGRSLIVAPPSKIVDIDIREIESSDTGRAQPSSCTVTDNVILETFYYIDN